MCVFCLIHYRRVFSTVYFFYIHACTYVTSFVITVKAFLRAWDDLCGATGGRPTLVIPHGKEFLLSPLSFKGPCKSKNLWIQLQGTLVAPGSMNAWDDNNKEKWIQFMQVNGLTIYGGGQIDGQGKIWWDYCQEDKSCPRPSVALSFHSCNNLRVSGLQHVNSQKNHISINGCNDVDISHLKITAPEESPNTDGIDISASNHLQIHDSFIGTGDDCVAINGFSSYINISRVLCGPGHGISIGSLGKGGAYETVEEVHVEDCTFKGTMNGARIKTWKGGRGYARKISFERIRMINAGNPIIIDQTYVNRMAAASTDEEYDAWSSSSSGDVEISDVSYKGVIGSSTDARAVYFNCGDGAGCRNIVVEDVEMTSAVAGKQLFAVCNNAHGTSSADRSPRVPCLLP
ncbi:unnamed protein product [Linum tenue]|uniref:Polygalacturonase n=1 Tax=Linum tenue TaxID=586396 RepID=A0AAV0I579_9ROSI|nr:unnamed protein product [Linum tenue]